MRTLLSLILFFTFTAAFSQTITRGPYLQLATQNSIYVRWRTNDSTSTRLLAGSSFNLQNIIISDSTRTTEHIVKVTGLSPDSRYYYSIGTIDTILQGDTLNHFRTLPQAGTERKYRIWVTGDCGTGLATQTQVLNSYNNFIGSNETDAWLLLGDNAYSSGTDLEYQTKFFQPYQNNRMMKQTVIWPSPGNHDYYVAGSNLGTLSMPYFDNFIVPANAEAGGIPSGSERYYSYDVGNIHFVSLNSYGTEGGKKMYDTTSLQSQWLKQDLAANQQKWTVLYWHHPPYTKGSHNSDTETDLVQIRQKFVRMLERYKVDMVLGGHSHSYERSKLIHGHYGNELSFADSLHNISNSSGKYDGSVNSCPYEKQSGDSASKGIVYVVAGSAGKVSGTTSGYPHNAMYYSNTSIGGSLYLEVEGNRLDAKWIAANGNVLDKFTIVKDANKNIADTSYWGEQLQLNSSWSGSHTWSNGQTSSAITLYPQTDTLLWVKDDQNCLTDTFRIHVLDTVRPVISNCPADTVLYSTMSGCGVSYSWNAPTASDNAGTASISGNMLSPFTFMPGAHEVVYTATDLSLNTSVCRFTVEVIDTLSPVRFNVEPDTLCLDQTSVDLSQFVTVSGGTFSGTAVNGNQFEPVASGEYILNYLISDANGCTVADSDTITVTICTGLKETSKMVLSVYPNPAVRYTNIRSTEPLLSVELCDLSGRVIRNISGTSTETVIDLSGLAEGFYVVKVKTQKSQTSRVLGIAREF